MYSIVLMMALSNSAATPSYQDVLASPESTRQSHQVYRGRRGCCGCSGGYSGCSGCSGGGYGGCYGGGGYGCSGGGYGGGYGGCSGGGYGGGYGCHGGYGGGYGGCSGGYSSGYSGMSYGSGYQGLPIVQPAAPTQPAPANVSPQASDPSRARIVVQLPAEARLTVDDSPTQSTSSVRTFISPPLESGKSYYYTLKAEINRDGQTLTTDRRITVRAGEQSNVKLEFPVASVAAR